MNALEASFRCLLIAAGLLLPGLGWALAWRWPFPWVAAGALSMLTVSAGLVGLSVLGLQINLGSMAAWLGVVAGGGWLWWRKQGSRALHAVRVPGEWWLAWPALPMVAVAVWRACTQPVPGVDADFRWDHLARLIIQAGHLDFYPPASPESFARYFWADGIAPLVSGVYTWTYLAAGDTAKIWTAIPVLLQVAGLFALLHALARSWQPEARAGWLACALAGGTMLLQFAINLGQETGLTALGAGGMACYLMHWQRTRETSLLVPAAVCAALVTCAREYGGVFLLAGAGWVAWIDRRKRSVMIFCGLAGALPLLWHSRVWLLTGNPVYAHDVAGLFAVNPVFHEWMQGYVETYGKVFTQASGWKEIGRYLIIGSLPALGGLMAGVALWRGRAGFGLWITLVTLSVVAWVVSVPFTAGGLFYSMRVLSPLLVLGCAWGGATLAKVASGPRQQMVLVGVLLLLGIDASLRALTIPLNPYSISRHEWPRAGYRLQDDFARENEPFLGAAADAATGRVLSESAGAQHLFQRRGKTLVPLWSPEVRFLFERDFSGDSVGRLRELGFSHLLLTRAQSSVDFLARMGAMGKLEGRMQPVMANDTFILLSLGDSMKQAKPTTR